MLSWSDVLDLKTELSQWENTGSLYKIISGSLPFLCVCFCASSGAFIQASIYLNNTWSDVWPFFTCTLVRSFTKVFFHSLTVNEVHVASHTVGCFIYFWVCFSHQTHSSGNKAPSVSPPQMIEIVMALNGPVPVLRLYPYGWSHFGWKCLLNDR